MFIRTFMVSFISLLLVCFFACSSDKKAEDETGGSWGYYSGGGSSVATGSDGSFGSIATGSGGSFGNVATGSGGTTPFTGVSTSSGGFGGSSGSGSMDAGPTTGRNSRTGPTAECGNDIIESGEQCDGTQLGGMTCSALGEGTGTLGCLASCVYDTRGCIADMDTGPYGRDTDTAEKSLELCLNSRYSEHVLTGTASEQQMKSVLWAAGKAPITGSFRNIYAANRNGTYRYDPIGDQLDSYSDYVVDRGAFVLSFERELHFDAGLSYMPAILFSISLWGSSESSVANCPLMSRLNFGVQDVKGLNSELVAHSSVTEGEDGWLPDPKTTGDNTVEEVLANLKYTNNFSQTNLTKPQISQILWAGYGCTPHTTIMGTMGLTVPSAAAIYYLTETIYLVNEIGVFRYHNRNPSGNLRTRDHRIERIKSGDARSSLQSAAGGLSQAPAYIILCLRSSTVLEEYAELEVGFVAGNILMQASAIDLGCHFRTKLTSEEQAAIRNTTDIPSSHTPLVVISIGNTPD